MMPMPPTAGISVSAENEAYCGFERSNLIEIITTACRTYGIVYKAQNKLSGTYVAIKKFKDSDDDEYVRRNLCVHSDLLLTK